MNTVVRDSSSARNVSAPTISIVTSVLNGAATLRRYLSSVLGQTNTDIEIVIVDGGSTDGTVEVLKEHAERLTYWVSEPDRGIYDAWNKALRRVGGDWILFLGVDDVLASSTVLERAASQLLSVPQDVHVAYGLVQVVDTRDRPQWVWGGPWRTVGPTLRYGMSIPHTGTFHRRTLFEKHGKFDDTFRIAGDFEFLLREVPTNPAYHLEGLVVTRMQQGGISSAPHMVAIRLKESIRARRCHGLVRGPSWIPDHYFVFFHRFRLLRLRATGRVVRQVKSLLGERGRKIVRDCWRYGRRVLR